MNEMRFYGQWSGNPKGLPENTDNCIAETFNYSWYSKQCSRKRVCGLYCKQHAKKQENRSVKNETKNKE